MKITMSQVEIAAFTQFLESCDHYFEYGMGGSTLLASRTVGKSVTAIESDAGWVSEVNKQLAAESHCIRNGSETNGITVNLHHIDIGKTGSWGMPVNNEARDLFSNYSKAIAFGDTERIDLCLVDGRFRVACFLEGLGQLRSDAVVAIHDYAVRPEYHVVEKFARPIYICQQLTFFVRRPGATTEAIARMADNYRFNPA